MWKIIAKLSGCIILSALKSITLHNNYFLLLPTWCLTFPLTMMDLGPADPPTLSKLKETGVKCLSSKHFHLCRSHFRSIDKSSQRSAEVSLPPADFQNQTKLIWINSAAFVQLTFLQESWHQICFILKMWWTGWPLIATGSINTFNITLISFLKLIFIFYLCFNSMNSLKKCFVCHGYCYVSDGDSGGVKEGQDNLSLALHQPLRVKRLSAFWHLKKNDI